MWWPIGILTIAVELGAPLALVAGRVRYGWLAVAWCFHVGLFMLMAISFPYRLLGVAYAPFVPLDRVADAVSDRVARGVTPFASTARDVEPS